MENLAFNNTNNVTVNGITVTAPEVSPNTDGVDPAGNNYLIENSNISTGDDDIAVKPQNSPVSGIVIQNDTIGSGHGISVGGETNDGLNGMTVNHITFNGTTNGLRLKAGIGNGGLVENITYSDITMQNVANPIYITSYYQNGGDQSPSNPATAVSQPLTSTTPIWKNITFSDITASGATKAGLIYGLPQAPAENITLNDVSISAQQAFDIYYAQNTILSGGTDSQSLSGLVTYDAPISTPEPSVGEIFITLSAALSLSPSLGRWRRYIVRK
jgi:polygalacturonase